MWLNLGGWKWVTCGRYCGRRLWSGLIGWCVWRQLVGILAMTLLGRRFWTSPELRTFCIRRAFSRRRWRWTKYCMRVVYVNKMCWLCYSRLGLCVVLLCINKKPISWMSWDLLCIILSNVVFANVVFEGWLGHPQCIKLHSNSIHFYPTMN